MDNSVLVPRSHNPSHRLMPNPRCTGSIKYTLQYMIQLLQDTPSHLRVMSGSQQLIAKLKTAQDGVQKHAATATSGKTPGQHQIRLSLWSPKTSNSRHSEISFIAPPSPRNQKPSTLLAMQLPHAGFASPGVSHTPKITAPFTQNQNCCSWGAWAGLRAQCLASPQFSDYDT